MSVPPVPQNEPGSGTRPDSSGVEGTVIQETVIQETVLIDDHAGATAGPAVSGMDVTMQDVLPDASGLPERRSGGPAPTDISATSGAPGASGDDLFNGRPNAAELPTTINPAELLLGRSSPIPNGEPSSSRAASTSRQLAPARSSSALTSTPALPPRQRTYRTGYIYDTLMMLHCVDDYQPTDEHVQDSGDGHPEEPMRIKRIFQRLKEAGLIARMKKLAFQQVSFEQVMLVHAEDHWAKVEGTQGM